MKAKTLIESDADAAKQFLRDLAQRLKETYGVQAKLETTGPGTSNTFWSGSFSAVIKINNARIFELEIGDLAWGLTPPRTPLKEIERRRGFSASLFEYGHGRNGNGTSSYFKNVGDALLAAEQLCETFCAKLGRSSPAATTASKFVVLFDGSGDGTGSTAKGYHYRDGLRLTDQEIVGSDFYISAIDCEPSAVVQLGETDAQVEKYGEWEVTSEILRQLAIAHYSLDLSPTSIQGEQAQVLLAHLGEVAELLNKGDGKGGGSVGE